MAAGGTRVRLVIVPWVLGGGGSPPRWAGRFSAGSLERSRTDLGPKTHGGVRRRPTGWLRSASHEDARDGGPARSPVSHEDAGQGRVDLAAAPAVRGDGPDA